MKTPTRFLFLATALLALLPRTQAGAAPESDTMEVKIMTFNIRYYRAPNDGQDAWDYRKRMVADLIQNSGADAIGLQEAEFPQVEYLRGRLEDDFGILATYTLGKHSNALLYRKDRFEVADWGTFWYSDTPDTPDSKGWGNSSPRFCTWARFVEIRTGKSFYYYNTHLDHKSQNSRERGALLLTERIKQRDPKAPFVVTGDLNSREENPVIRFFKGKKLSIDGRSFKNPVPLIDTFRAKHGEQAEAGTFNGFDPDREFLKIDYVFTERSTEVLDAGIITYSKNGHYPSDHFPVTATLRFR